jgi:hypothetical protein
VFKYTRFLAQMSVGTLPHEKMMRSFELVWNGGGTGGEEN